MRQQNNKSAVGQPIRHDSAHLHVTGRATYVDDIPELRGTLYAAVGQSARAHARVTSLDLSAVLSAPGVVAVMTAKDIPGKNDCGPMVDDEPILADGLVQCVGQALFSVAARSIEQARRAVRLAIVEYEDLEPIFTVQEAIAAQSFVLPTMHLRRGDAKPAISKAPHRLRGSIRMGGQEQFYLEGHIAYAVPRDDGGMHIYTSTQHPTETQMHVAHALHLAEKDVVAECRRMGGGFGGKESGSVLFACNAALLAQKTGRPVKLRVDRDDDMVMTGKRHDFETSFEVGFDRDGRIRGIEMDVAGRCGYSADLSAGVNDRAALTSDNTYFLENVAIHSYRCKTNTVSATAFRGFGGPQGALGIEQVIEEIAFHLGKDPLEVRKANLYGIEERNVTHYGQVLKDNVIADLISKLELSSGYADRRRDARTFNATSGHLKKGIALTPLKYGISFTAPHLNQAGALVHVYTDGSVMLNHGGTEMGQGLFTKVAQVVSEEFGIDVDRIRITASDTSKVPNTSATAASSGSDLNGKAAQDAARRIRQRLAGLAAAHFGVVQESVHFARNEVRAGDQAISFAELAQLAHFNQISLSANGYYRTPMLDWDAKTLTGTRPFYYFVYGAAVSEVLVDILTGESRVLRTDILHDVGRSLNPAIDRGQIEGAFAQGMGWLTMEELCWDAKGRLTTHAPSTYKIPVASDMPRDFRVALYESPGNVEDSIHRSKAIGEPPVLHGISVFHALRDAIASVADYTLSPRLDAPATAERILFSVIDLQRRAAAMRAPQEVLAV
ncbi:xanthine dehydrogenase molybdopterin binding subunit [Variovorax sp. Sphag1AA]|uniref:xanthine dehydrogenase molybdopterin binding subunit n=1 Tax=Variovorax sp. Sphag1AA TaxID=2587027 RepID=UPI0016121464|nr:xanthine dehydrogenase molybdopterin binding subunit [Variovorax sp. Sphag1AA]MBB3182029.1 xanthine dehydrogenase large subunit [Variovorax sp. Sphag1AA]